jgi:hypothetical protein
MQARVGSTGGWEATMVATSLCHGRAMTAVIRVLENIQKLRPPNMYQYIFPSYRDDSHKFQKKSGVDGHAKPRAKQRTQKSSQPQGQPQTTSPTCVSRVTWGPSQVILIPDWSNGSHKGSHKRSHQDPTKGCPRDPTKNQQRIGDGPRQFRK